MYWVYVLIFLTIMLIPAFIQRGELFIIVNTEITETILIFILSTAAWAIFYWKYCQHEKLLKLNKQCLTETFHTSKDLSTTYGYIGQINRKLDILRNIVLGLPSSTKVSDSKQDYYAITEALEMFSGCKQYLIGFYDYKSHKVLREIKSDEQFNPEVERKACLKDKNTVLKLDNLYFLRTKQKVYHIGAYAILDKNVLHNQDIDLIKSILAQALFLFIYSKEKLNRNQNHNNFWRT